MSSNSRHLVLEIQVAQNYLILYLRIPYVKQDKLVPKDFVIRWYCSISIISPWPLLPNKEPLWEYITS